MGHKSNDFTYIKLYNNFCSYLLVLIVITKYIYYIHLRKSIIRYDTII